MNNLQSMKINVNHPEVQQLIGRNARPKVNLTRPHSALVEISALVGGWAEFASDNFRPAAPVVGPGSYIPGGYHDHRSPGEVPKTRDDIAA